MLALGQFVGTRWVVERWLLIAVCRDEVGG